MKAGGGETEDDDEGECMDGRLLVAYGGSLFEVDSRYGILDVSLPYHAIGCAARVALGAMHARRGSHAKSVVEAGLEAAAAFDINIRPPFTVESIKRASGK